MAKKGYFERIYEKTPTRMWVNNPTASQARTAIEHGAIHCTTNPSYAGKMLSSQEMHPQILTWIGEALGAFSHPQDVAAAVQRSAIANLLDIFLPLYERAPGRLGFVSIQGDPLREHDPDAIIREALLDRKLGPNVIAKVPVTQAGIQAIGVLIEKNVPIIATEIMSISQVIAICDAYTAAARRSGMEPPFFVTCIAGIFDQRLWTTTRGGWISITTRCTRRALC